MWANETQKPQQTAGPKKKAEEVRKKETEKTLQRVSTSDQDLTFLSILVVIFVVLLVAPPRPFDVGC
jgi:uncharacterized membrane protein